MTLASRASVAASSTIPPAVRSSSRTPPMKPIHRSLLAVLAGFVFIGALVNAATLGLAAAGVLPPAQGPIFDIGTLLAIQAIVAVIAIAGCWLTAWLAPSHPLRHALIEGVLGLAITVASVIVRWELQPVWYSVLALATVMPYAWIGGRLREMQLARASVAVA